VGYKVPETDQGNEDDYTVEVSMSVSKKGRSVETKKIDFGHLKEAQVRGLTDLFTMLAQNFEYIKKLTPQFEKLDKSKPSYLQ
jgi:Zn-finger domain-containing protein